MSVTALYLDSLNRHMEKMILDMCPDDVILKFLDPQIGVKGTLAEADVFIDTTFRVTKEIIDQAPNLKLIQRTGVGVDMVDMDYAGQKGIPVSICKGFNSSSVAELAILYMLALYRRLVTLDELSRKGEWHTWTYRHDSYELFGKTVGVLGGGTIGKEVMKRIKAFGCRVIYSDVRRMPEDMEREIGCEYAAFNELIAQSDVISIHAPLTDGTRGMVGEKEFARMKPSVILINTARSQIIDEEALIDALKTGKVWGAAVDVFEPEDRLFGLDGLNLITTPHIGAATYDNYYRGYKFCLENSRRIGRGEAPLFTV